MKKRWMTAVLAAAMTAAFAFSAFAGEWLQDERGYQYKNDSGSFARDQILNIDGVNYGFDQDAYMVTGWKMMQSKWYYFEPGAGNMALGWKQLGEDWYYLDSSDNGAMKTSWLRIDGKLYYFQESGAMQRANTRFYVDSFAYETDATGAVKRNMSEDKGDGRIFIYEDDGRMKYKNNTLETGNRAAGTDVYVYLLEGQLNEQTKADTKQAISDEIEYRKEQLYEEYKQKVVTETRSKRRAEKQEKWEARVNHELGELDASQSDINEYIYKVKTGRFNTDDSSYEDYSYDESYYEE